MANFIREKLAGPFVRASIWSSRQWQSVQELAARVPAHLEVELRKRSSAGKPLLAHGFGFASFSNRTAGIHGDSTDHRPLATLSSRGFRRRATEAVKKALELTPFEFERFSVERQKFVGGESADLLLHVKLKPGAERQPFLGTTYARLDAHRLEVAAIWGRVGKDRGDFP